MTQYVLLKRDLYECPGHQGYTGIRDKAGRWLAEEFAGHSIPIKEKYTPKEREHYAIPLDAAPEFTNECFHDLSLAHLRGKVERLQEALTPSGATKAAYIGEFSFGIDDRDEDGDECTRTVVVPWTTVKEIMSAIRERAEMKEAA
ncbi:hypothetical protein [Agrobacterium pusense]|uniref:hypothetical protein n=1 Tax=Agrobacterium pusense TaxID=648995 RepID=UPI00088808CD|nr:hypothetical protein [Agrobacterium pusense]OOO23410.1 hypothetical protein BTE56_03235 [Agrobacterium pusense]WKD45025.1 hypothetical protein M8C82_16615 [Agrobacterium pusense]SDE62738.1 hypothetical protein SAMN05421750_102588 [Agrobacterium pusense]